MIKMLRINEIITDAKNQGWKVEKLIGKGEFGEVYSRRKFLIVVAILY